jgi:hypothetical protein
MTYHVDAENLHRLVKQAIDSGIARSITEAQAMFDGYRLAIEIDAESARNKGCQTMLLTTVALARRVFLGGVSVSGFVDVPNITHLPLSPGLREAIEALGGRISEDGSAEVPTIVIGTKSIRRDTFAIRPIAAGWRGGILPAYSALSITGEPAMPLAGMLAAALAVNEAFLHVNSNAPAAGRRVVGFSLWRPGGKRNWLELDPEEPRLTYLPSKLWLIGLGHLGQAYLWGLGLLPYARPADLSLVFQDIDAITASTESTSILTDASLLGVRKTRAMAAWAERRGFQTAIYERLFDSSFRLQTSEPTVALCGLDNAAGRRVLDQVGFDLVVEAGLGRGYRDFRTMRLHCLPGPSPSAEMWKAAVPREKVEERPAYTRLLEDGSLDRCGMTLLAGKAVGAPFVGAVAASLALSEVIRLLHGGPVHQLIDLDLLSVEHRLAVPHPHNFCNLNPGFALSES